MCLLTDRGKQGMAGNGKTADMNKDGISLSVIIPVYNAGKYLDSCICSLLKAEVSSGIQIILVDDGSTDGSGAAADGHAEKYGNISVIHKANEGPAEARNAGMRMAEGRYIFFCDADDEVVPELFSEVIGMAGNASEDIILWDAEPFDDEGNEFPQKRKDYFIHRGLKESGGAVSGCGVMEKMLDDCGDFPATVWLGIHRTGYLKDNGLFFEKGLLHEDELWAVKTLLSAKTVRYVPQKIYRYRIHKGSITNPEVIDWRKNIESMLRLYPELFGFCDERIGDISLRKKVKAALAHRYIHMIFEYDFTGYGYGGKIDRKQLWDISDRLIDKCRLMLLALKVRNGSSRAKDVS